MATIRVSFHKNDGTTTSVPKDYYTGVRNQYFTNNGWTREGYEFWGYSSDPNAVVAEYPGNAEVVDSWITANAPSITLYAVWHSPDVMVRRNGKYVAGDIFVKRNGKYVAGDVYVRRNGKYVRTRS